MPILIQKVITSFVSLLDNIMVGQVGTEPMSGVTIVNQMYFVFFLCIFGGLSGAGTGRPDPGRPEEHAGEIRITRSRERIINV